jgi:hypothetical protein
MKEGGGRTGEEHEFLSEAEAAVGAQDGDGVDVAADFGVLFVRLFVVVSVGVK